MGMKQRGAEKLKKSYENVVTRNYKCWTLGYDDGLVNLAMYQD